MTMQECTDLLAVSLAKAMIAESQRRPQVDWNETYGEIKKNLAIVERLLLRLHRLTSDALCHGRVDVQERWEIWEQIDRRARRIRDTLRGEAEFASEWSAIVRGYARYFFELRKTQG